MGQSLAHWYVSRVSQVLGNSQPFTRLLSVSTNSRRLGKGQVAKSSSKRVNLVLHVRSNTNTRICDAGVV